MFRLLGRLMGPRIAVGVLGLALAVAWQAWMLVRPRPLPLDTQRLALAEEAAGRLAQSMPQPQTSKPTLAVARFEFDPTGQVTDAVRRAIDRTDRYAVQPTTMAQNARRELGIEEKPLALDADLTADLAGLGAEYVLAGRVFALRDGIDRREAMLEAVLVPVNSPSQRVRLSAKAGHEQADTQTAATVRSYPWPARLVSWLALMLLLPLVFIPLARRGLQRESNLVNLAMLLGLTLLSSAAAYAMIGFRIDTAWSASLLVAAVGGALAYNWSILAKMESLRRE